MAGTLYITEYQYLGRQGGQSVQLPLTPPVIFNNNIAISGASTQCAAFNAKTNFVRVHNDATQPVFIRVGGTNPTAISGSDERLAVNQTEYYFVSPGDKIAVIT